MIVLHVNCHLDCRSSSEFMTARSNQQFCKSQSRLARKRPKCPISCVWPPRSDPVDPGAANIVSGELAIAAGAGYLFVVKGRGAQKLTAFVLLAAILFGTLIPRINAAPVPRAEPYSNRQLGSFVTPQDLQIAVDNAKLEIFKIMELHQGVIANHSGDLLLGKSRHEQLIRRTNGAVENFTSTFNRKLDDLASTMIKKVFVFSSLTDRDYCKFVDSYSTCAKI